MKTTYIILIGNPIDGFACYGPFDTRKLAIEWAEKEGESDWFLSTLYYPA